LVEQSAALRQNGAHQYLNRRRDRDEPLGESLSLLPAERIQRRRPMPLKDTACVGVGLTVAEKKDVAGRHRLTSVFRIIPSDV